MWMSLFSCEELMFAKHCHRKSSNSLEGEFQSREEEEEKERKSRARIVEEERRVIPIRQRLPIFDVFRLAVNLKRKFNLPSCLLKRFQNSLSVKSYLTVYCEFNRV